MYPSNGASTPITPTKRMCHKSHLCQMNWEKQQGIKNDKLPLHCCEHHPHLHARNRLPTLLLATSLPRAVAENIAMH
jgi:hypothetical protein